MGTRTTLTLLPDVEIRVKALMDSEGLSFKDAINRVLQAGLDQLDQNRPPRKPFKVKPFRGGVQPGFDADRSPSKILDEMEDFELARRLGLAQ